MKTPEEIRQRIALVEAQLESAVEVANNLAFDFTVKAQKLGTGDLLRSEFREKIEDMEKTMTENQHALYALIASLEQLYWVAGMDNELLDLQRQKLAAQAN